MTKFAKVLFFTEAGLSYGLGHLRRSWALLEEFAAQSWDVRMMVKGVVPADLASDVRVLMSDWTQRLPQIDSATVVVVDSYTATADIYRQLASCGVQLLCFDDTVRLDYPDGSLIINGSPGALQLPYRRHGQQVYLLGPDYVVLRKAFCIHRSMKMPQERKYIVLSLGGGSWEHVLQDLLTYVKQEFPHCPVKMISAQPVQKIKLDKEDVVVSPSADQLVDVLSGARMLVCGGGQSAYEAMALGCPVLALCLADNQEHHVKSLAAEGLVTFLGWYNDGAVARRLKENVRTFLNDDHVWLSCSQRLQHAIDGQGARRIVARVKG